jgi:WYL domain
VSSCTTSPQRPRISRCIHPDAVRSQLVSKFTYQPGHAGSRGPVPPPDLGRHIKRNSTDPQTERWFRVELHAERLGWLPPLLASLDRPFAVERPDELRDLIAALASRLATSARRNAPRQ